MFHPRHPAGQLPALLTGFTLVLRAVGEYGSVIFIAGNILMKTEITQLIIRLEEYDRRRRRAGLRNGHLLLHAVHDQPAAGLGCRRLVAGRRK
jgi:ABC-type molybdate transport system permease subunit